MKNNKKNREMLIASLGIEGAMHLMNPDDEFMGPVKLKDCDRPVIVIDDKPSPKKVIEINGIMYERRERDIPSKRSGRITALMAGAMLMGGGMPSIGMNRKRPVVNIEEEFELIQKKQSKLARNDRDWVCNQFLYDWKQID